MALPGGTFSGVQAGAGGANSRVARTSKMLVEIISKAPHHTRATRSVS